MKRAILAAFTCCAIAGLAIGASNPPKKAATPVKKSAAVAKTPAGPVATTATRTPAHSASAAVRTPVPARTASRAPVRNNVRTASSRRYYYRLPVRRTFAPQQPSPDRYKEIQDALAAKGYLTSPSSGVWDKDSVTAMQHFQQDQNLNPSGKLTARSLSALGLGPKTEAMSMPPSASAFNSSAGDSSPLQ
jgi:hypothetical protein